MGLSDSVVIVISILVAGFVVIMGAVILKFVYGQNDNDPAFTTPTSDQEHYMREVRSRNRACNHFESRYGDRYPPPKTAGASTVSASNLYSA